jgi:flavin reductase (DIM6/NTAB) family NADH-FMN oxidoreductase RutF
LPDNADMSEISPASLAVRAEPPFTRQEFRQALGLFATGVTIVTARAADGTPVGLTVNSFNSVSLSPPLVLWSLARAAGSLPVFSGGSHYAIHILAAEQRALAERFATREIDRFADLSWTEGAGGIPLIDGDRKSTRLNSSHNPATRMPSSA